MVRDLWKPNSELAPQPAPDVESRFPVDYRAIVELIDIGITKIDPGTGRIYFANEVFCRMLGYSAHEFSDGTISFVEITHPDDLEKNFSLHQQLLRGQIDQYTIEKRYIRKDGSTFWGRATAKHLPESDIDRKRTLCLIEDISDQVAARSQPGLIHGGRNTVAVAAHHAKRRLTSLDRAEDYIQQNWDKPLRMAELAAACDTSTRTLFRGFRKAHACSPAVYVKRVKLRRARDILMRGDRSLSITGLALAMGFANAGHFARDYRRAFGELPSATHRQGRIARERREVD